jgi:serine/threonine protein kinase
MNWTIGQILDDRYEVKQVFTSGGMGSVYRVRHLGWGIDLAMKCPNEVSAKSIEAVSAFEQEIETWAELGLHPNVATCYYSLRIQDVLCAFAEFVDGGSLRDWITSRRLYRGGEEAAISRILSISVQSAWGLHWAHQHGLVHQDVKTGNILMSVDGNAKVTDFGLTRCQRDSSGMLTATLHSTVTIAGWTPLYGSPEQAAGHRLSSATDIWSWAVSVMELFMGGIHWHSGPVACAALQEYNQLGRRTHEMPEMPRELLALLSRCLEREPSLRPDSFMRIAEILLHLHKKIFGEPCDVVEPDTDFLAADALNNRGVSLAETGRIEAAVQRFTKCVSLDALHPEANCNLIVTRVHAGTLSPFEAKQALERCRQAWWNRPEALILANAAKLWIEKRTNGESTAPAGYLAVPKTGAEHAADASRFKRLLSKVEAAINEGRRDDARRYFMMAQEIPGYSRHPRLKSIAHEIGS